MCVLYLALLLLLSCQSLADVGVNEKTDKITTNSTLRGACYGPHCLPHPPRCCLCQCSCKHGVAINGLIR
ncbi:hypothetical protein AAHC03_022946 [Spirometra sp. Aus1]